MFAIMNVFDSHSVDYVASVLRAECSFLRSRYMLTYQLAVERLLYRLRENQLTVIDLGNRPDGLLIKCNINQRCSLA